MEYLKIGDVIAGVIVRQAMLADTTGFFTPSSLPLQAGVMAYPRAHVIPRHMHQPQQRSISGTTEAILVQQGRLTLHFYAAADAEPQSVPLHAGDLVILYAGGHGFTADSDVRILEIKQGPYLEHDDKQCF